MRTKEGPTTISCVSQCCGLCKWHRQDMVQSGQRPVYRHSCEHESVASHLNCKVSGCIERDWFGKGRTIGDEDITPSWCPVIGGNT